jgi:hypothetical protein
VVHGKASLFQAAADEAGDGRIVFNDERAHAV